MPTGRQVLAAPGVTAFLVAQFTMTVGVMLQAAALGKHIYDITGNALDIGWLGLAEFLPAALLVLVTGTVADRFDRKRIVVFAFLGELMCAVAFMLYARTDPTTTVFMFTVAFVFGVMRAFAGPAVRTIPPMIAPPNGLPRVIALSSATWTGAAIVGPAVSGFMYAIAPWVAYAAAGCLMTLGILAFLTIEVPPAAHQQVENRERPTLRHAMEGLRFIRRTPVLLAAISLDLFAVLFGGAIALLPVIAEERLGVGDVAYGWLRAASGMGAAAMAVFLATRPVTRRVGRTLLIAVFVFGVHSVVLGLTHSYVVAFVAVLIGSAADMVSVFIRSSLVPLVTPDEKRGRVTAVEGVFIGASNELGAFESGAAASLVGVPATVVGGGIATIGIVGFFWSKFPTLRRIDRFEDLSAE
ncbi:MAG: MFS transporter [Acidimicrobiales bacterium]